ncbi:PLxRFG domain-containing protein [uncultured Variovorax sp.]|uniref:PLxRFG domain-containing protein n=1 Tax=uncultured Variovorax sp. TaxID=114708 RepID=UPI0025F6ACD4|nr:PLxRFG domain-containing protein [uncultured Variovorax sp.]
MSDSGLNETHRIVPQNRRFVVQQKDAAPAADVPAQAGTNGSQPKGEWAAFASDSGTKGVPRAEMPQIKAEHRGAMTNFMNARGIAHAEETVPAASLKPTQAEFSPARVQQAKEFQGGDRAILVSRDGHVLDGHHQWLAARERGGDVRVIRLDAPIQDLLTAAHEFPSSTTDAASASAQPPAVTPEKAGSPGNASEKPARGVVAKVREARAKRELKADRIAREAEEARASYFTPGNVVRSYGQGFDEVVSYKPSDKEGNWSVTVRAARQVGVAKFEPIPGERERTHSTQPSERELKVGPAARSAAASQPAPAPIAAPPAEPANDAGKIVDFGEKIGGARKDRAEKGGSRASAAPKDDRPAWARRFEVSQITKSRNASEEGRWVIRDARTLDAFKQPRQVGRDSYATREEAEAAIPLAAVSLKHRVTATREGMFEIWRDVTDRKRVKVVDQSFDTREDALRYMAANAQAIIETNTTFGEADLPRPAGEQRVGPERRDGDVKDSDFTSTFGFRGVEFGNWNNQADRQQLLNDAYDGLLDLADVMGLPPRAISLNGELALAFGARGSGLSGARAHYEPAKAVINLTKMNGAGSLAHEWFHALDHYFGRQDGKAPAEWVTDKDGTRSLKINGDFERNAASSGTRGERSGIRAEVQDAYRDLMNTMTRKAEQYTEDTAKADKFVGATRKDVEDRLAGIRKYLAEPLPEYFKRNNKPATAAQLAEFDTLAQQIINGEALELRIQSKNPSAAARLAGYRWTNDVLEKMSGILKIVRGQAGFSADQRGTLDALRGDMQRYSQRLKMLADAQQSTQKTRSVPTSFAMDARELDQGRGQDYWTSPHEMAARAFQGYIEDKVAERGGASPFLNFGPENAGIMTPWGVKRPFPHGAERLAINQALDKLVGVIQTREGEGGNMALFRRADDGLSGMTPAAAEAMRLLSRMPYSPRARMQAVQSVQKTVTAIRSAWGNAPEIVVAFDMNDAAVPEAARRADLRQRSGGARGAPEGFYYRGKAYLMASRLASPEDAARVLYHEVLGHHALRGTFGKQLDGVLNQIATMRRADVDAKIREYGLRGVSKLDRRAAAEEVLAEMAQNTPELHFVRRAVAAIRTWLREHVPGFRGLRLTDDEIIRNFILPARQFVERGAGAAKPGTELAFSRAEGADADAESREFLDGAPVAEMSGKEFASDGVPLTEKVTQFYESTGNGQVDVPGIGLVSLDRQAVKSSLFHGIGRDKATAFAAVPDVLKNGKIIHAEAMEGSRDAGMVYHVAAPVRIGDRDMVEVVLMKADSNAKRMYVHEVVLKEKLRQTAFKTGAGAAEAGVQARAGAGAIRSVLDRIYSVNPAADEGGAAHGSTGAEPDESEPLFSRSKVGEYARTAAAELNKTFSAPGGLSWWHKTIGTIYNLAERSPAFKPVFDAAQGFVDDVSHYATDAAELAPQLLPKLETWRDIKKSPISAADNVAVAKPVFEGTLIWARDEQGKPVPVQALIDAAAGLTAEHKAQRLLRNGQIDERMLKAWQGMPLESYEKAVASRYESRMLQPGVVWSDAELRSMFQLNDDQLGLYREFREATNRSLDTMARADMLRFAGEDAKGLRTMVMDAPDAQAAAVLIRDHLAQLASDQPDRSTLLMNTANGIIDRADKVRDLQARGYAPLSRFGRYSVDVVDSKGERQYFGLFETAREANKMASSMRSEFGDAAVSQGTLSEEAFKMFAGVTPETLELFGNALGLDATGDRAQDQAFQEYLKLTKTNRSAMRRLMHRKGIAGFSEDVGRVLASFIYSNARQTAAGLNMGDMGEAVNAIPKELGELKDVAVRLAEYVKNPQEEAQVVRGLLFAQYLGGSIASAFVNMTQPVAVTFPWLSQFGGARKAAAALGAAAKNMATKGFQYEPDLAKALKTAEEDGVVSPQEVHQLMAQARGSGSLRAGDGTRLGDARAAGQNALSRLSLAWGKVFGAAEQVNRRITFIAAYRVARDRGDADPAAFASRAVKETQFVYSKASKMHWGRGAVGGTLITFKTYSIAYLELLHRMSTQGGPEGKRAALLALGMLMLMGGSGGLPFAEDVEDLADALAQLLGYNFSAKKARQEVFEAMLPKGIADFLDKGVSGLPGAPLDVSGRLGMGNLIPGTGLLQQKTSHTRDVLEIAGPAGDFASRIFSGALNVAKGNVGAGALEVAPTAVRNAAKGVDMATTGMYRDAKGYKVLDTNHLEAALKAIGFQPQSVATIQEANSINQQAKGFYNLRAQEIRGQWAAGIFEKDEGKVRDARAAIAEWNAKNPEQPMLIRIPDVMRRVREMQKSKDQRIADTAPRAMRAHMREEVARVRAEAG